MNMDDVNSIKDKIIVLSASSDSFDLLSAKQKLVGAVEMLVSTASRSGVEVFFEKQNKYLWHDALLALKEFNAVKSYPLYEKALNNLNNGNKKNEDLRDLQDALVITEYDLIESAVYKYISDHPKIKNLKND